MGLAPGWGEYATTEAITPIDKAFPLAAPKASGGTGGFGNFFSSPAGFFASTAVNSLLSGFGQANTAQSANTAQGAAMQMFGANTGRSDFGLRRDYFMQKQAPIDEARIIMNPEYRAADRRTTLLNPGIAGKYAAFMNA